MPFNLIDSVSDLFNHEVIRKASSSLGETESSVIKAVGAGIPSVLSGILSTAGTDSGSNVLSLAKQAAGSGILDNVWGLFSGGSSSSLLNAGSSLLLGLFGNKVSGLSSHISNFSGVKQSSANSILNAIAPIALGFIGKHAITNNLNGSGILSWLNGQKSQIANALPAGVNLSGIFDGGAVKIADTVKTVYVEPKKKGNNWILPLLLALLAAVLLWYFVKGCNKDASTPVVTDTAPTDTVPKIEAPVVGSINVNLPDGTELSAFRGGIEDKLVSFLSDPGAVADKTTWFDFDNLNFELGSANITAESQKQIRNIVAILTAFPKTKIKIGGYTDKTGDDASNLKLSQSRADAVLAALTTAGANPGQLVVAEGYGSQFAKIPVNASDEERKVDRRISINVREK